VRASRYYFKCVCLCVSVCLFVSVCVCVWGGVQLLCVGERGERKLLLYASLSYVSVCACVCVCGGAGGGRVCF